MLNNYSKFNVNKITIVFYRILWYNVLYSLFLILINCSH